MRRHEHLPTALVSAFWPELPSRQEVVDRVAAVASPEAIAAWLRGHREAPDVVPELRLDPRVAANVAIIVQPLTRAA